ncbi:hypothetical protein Poly30_16580 [Planctomycetes bacterium Poly30]|uniref:Uncharacterized protein n=1 Tax=Saltatorellus ferox TaxID=2528018 RepID=A0A518EPY4_9BACT|nr:hypothetical protein Poly30_16580 [Planctomycetes bacterium Poly30]
MALFHRTLLLVALVIQAALGPAGLTLDVCHGRLQWAAPSGESCCGAEESAPVACSCSHEHEATPARPEQRQPSLEDSDGCSTCFQVAVDGSDDAFEARSLDFSPVLALVPLTAWTALPAPAPMTAAPPLSRAPPGCVRPHGLLPGTFPLRI